MSKRVTLGPPPDLPAKLGFASLESHSIAARLPRLDSSIGVLCVLLAIALVRGLLYAVLTPPFDGPDEQAHLQYVAYLATSGHSGPIGEEGHQPIGYYALMAPIYWLVAGQPVDIQLLAVRVASIPFLLGTVAFTWLAARRMAPGSTFLPVVAAGFVALHPGLAYFSASASNDNAANLMASVLTYLVVALLTGNPRVWVAPATVLAIGAAILTKGQILPVVAVSAMVLAVHIIARTRAFGRWKLLLYAMVPVLLAAEALAGTAGERMVNIAADSGSLVVDWSRAWGIAQQSASQQPFSFMFITFWTAYLGGAVRPADAWYIGLAVVMLVGVIGYPLRLAGRRVQMRRSAVLLRVALLGMLLGVGLVAYLRYLYVYQDASYQWRIQVLQGHFLHVAVAPLALLVGEGWGLLAPSRVRATAGWAILTLLVAFDVASLAVLASHYAWR